MKLCRVARDRRRSGAPPGLRRAEAAHRQRPIDGGDSFLAVDRVQAGVGDTVLVNQEGNGARQLLKMGQQVPIRSLIVGVVDEVQRDE